MRKEPFFVGDFVHVVNRGNRKMNIVRDFADKRRFLACLRYYNDESPAEFLMREAYREGNGPDLLNFDLQNSSGFTWPVKKPQKPIVNVVAYALMTNHYHLLLEEIVDGGIAEFERKLGIGLTGYTNKRYGESGRLFQGSYRARLIREIQYLQYINVYIEVLNPFELLTDTGPLNDFDRSFNQILANPFTSLGESIGVRDFSITNRKNFLERCHLPTYKDNYKKFTRNVLFANGLKKFIDESHVEF